MRFFPLIDEIMVKKLFLFDVKPSKNKLDNLRNKKKYFYVVKLSQSKLYDNMLRFFNSGN